MSNFKISEDKLELDSLVKSCLCNKSSVKDAANKDNLTDLVVARVANQKLLKNKIESWRKQHEDWESLASFIKGHISRRLKKRKSTDKIIEKVEALKDNVENVKNEKVEKVENVKNESKPSSKPNEAKTVVKDSNSKSCANNQTSSPHSCEAADDDASITKSQSDEIVLMSSHDMIVKRCRMDECTDEIFVGSAVPAKDPSITEATSNIKNEKFDSFFEGGEDSDDDEDKKSCAVILSSHNDIRSQFVSSLGNPNKIFKKTANKSSFPEDRNKNAHKQSKSFKAESKKDNKGKEELKETKLHPSWEAKRKLKEKLAPNVKFMGKKIIFDD
ncbi:hypothetical protein HELRODRAFT_161512 [Helobdella robusta]|uniref:Serum response factor-binding protein 1 n=1 Tax=Helobdella robusta TaxID=6412 RepID=T1ERK6_HELRO|nr:hypothetical protein HELRODRAFT_161512 [Helobdella robusta]ESO02264.1 hypothetical protein HELRODRAFT_161512 [Helobdella robusta]